MTEECSAVVAQGFSRERYFAVIVVLTLLAFGLRLPGLAWGMPFIGPYNSDNERFVQDAAVMASKRDPNPHWFGLPGSTIIYPLAAVFVITNQIDRLSEQTDLTVGELFDRDPSSFFAMGRTYSALFGAALIPLGFALGKRSGSHFAGLVAAVLLAISPLHVKFSHEARPDVIGVFCASLGMLASVALLRRPQWRYYALAGVAFGLAISAKYYMVLLAVGLPLSHLARAHRDRQTNQDGRATATFTKIIVGLSLVILTFALTTPFLFIEFSTTIKDLRHEQRTTNLSADGLAPLENAWWYLTAVISGSKVYPAGGVGPLSALLALWGTLTALHRRNQVLIVYLASSLVFMAGISIQALHWDRWIIPILPFVAVLTGTGLEFIVLALQKLRSVPSWAVSGLVLLIVLVSLWPACSTIRYNVHRVVRNTRQMAQEWVESSLPYQSKILTETYSIPILPGRFAHHEYEYSIGLHPLEYYNEQGYDYLIVSQSMITRYLNERERYPEIVANYERIQAETELIQAFRPEQWRISGPTIYIYRLREQS